jgi:protein-tyrosine phosphatase
MDKAKTSESHPLRVDFVDCAAVALRGRLGMTFAPGKKQRDALTGPWDRDLDSDLARLRDEYHTDVLVSLMEEHEYEELQIAGLRERAADYGIEVLWFPIRDTSCPESDEEFDEAVGRIVGALRDGKTVIIHCKGGLGRTGLTAAAGLLSASSELTAGEAISAVRRARAGAVENERQEEFVAGYASRIRRRGQPAGFGDCASSR